MSRVAATAQAARTLSGAHPSGGLLTRARGEHDSARGGRALPATFSRHFAADVGPLIERVRVHDDHAGAAVARRHGAIALAHGADLYFAEGAYRPQTPTGRELVAHELVHVVQQHRLSGRPPGASAEAEADAAARTGALNAGDLGPPRPVVQRRTPAEQIATVLRRAVEGWGTDEDAIFAALTGRTPVEIADVEREYAALSGGETLEARLRDELSGGDLVRAMALLRGGPEAVTAPALIPTQLAEQLHAAVEGLGTDEGAINGVLMGRTPAELTAIRAEYQRLYHESLDARLQDELSGGELIESSIAARAGVLEPVDEIKVAVKGAGTDEERLFAVLTQVSARGDVERTIDAYAAKGYGDMLEDIRGDLSGKDLDRAMELLHGPTPTATCTTGEREEALEALSEAISLAQGAVERLDADIARGRLSYGVRAALERNFNPADQTGAVTLALAAQVRPILAAARLDMLRTSQLRCGPDPTCKGNCSSKHTGAFTIVIPGAEVHVCPAFFTCGDDRAVIVLHEFVHHGGLRDTAYVGQAGWSALTPAVAIGNPDSHAHFAREVN